MNRAYLRSQILPHFAGRQVADIDSRDVANWFASLRATPVAADRSMPVLSVIMREDEAMGLRPEGSNPCKGIRRYRCEGRERFLSDDEIRRLSAVLTAHEGRYPEQVAVVRLLLLTGCRKGEILTLRWSDYREGRCSSAIRSRVPEPSGCPSRPGTFSTPWRERAAGCSPRTGRQARRATAGWTGSGGSSAPRGRVPRSGVRASRFTRHPAGRAGFFRLPRRTA